MGKCGIAESHRLAEDGDVVRPGVVEAAAAAAMRAADEATAAAAAAAANSEKNDDDDDDDDDDGEEIDLDAPVADSEDDADNVDGENDDLEDEMDDIDALMDGMVQGGDGDLFSDTVLGNQADDDAGDQVERQQLHYVRTPPSDKLVLSAALMCAVRVSVMNETDVDLLCPRARGAWDDHKCEDEIFSEYVVDVISVCRV